MTNRRTESFPTVLANDRARVPVRLNAEQLRAVRQWAADDGLWTTEETVAFNLEVFARVILAADR